ncbi:MAG: hypothetical protein HY897_17085 [Deltaproteobacteria bacterium]|nr:hypothetical protein [Deltaproteobacteria bacterium]
MRLNTTCLALFGTLAWAFAGPALPAHAEETGSKAPAAKKRVLIINIPASEKLPKEETQLLDGVLCSEATKLDAFIVICAGNVDETMKFKDFSQQFGGGGACGTGQCMEGLVDRYQPDLIIRTTARKSGSVIEFAVKLLNDKGTSILGTLSNTISTKDAKFIEKLGEMVRKLLAPPKEPAQPPAQPSTAK